jgi:hypothetical protein
MKPLAIVLVMACCIGAGYGYWGAFTASGNREYEGMAALLPFYIMLGSLGLLLVVGLYYAVIAIIRKGKT